MSGPRIIAGDETFRIVRVEEGNKITHVVELPDNCDALGVERWRDAEVNGKVAKALFSYVLKTITAQENK